MIKAMTRSAEITPNQSKKVLSWFESRKGESLKCSCFKSFFEGVVAAWGAVDDFDFFDDFLLLLSVFLGLVDGFLVV